MNTKTTLRKKGKAAAILLAGGCGSRFSGDEKKQFVPVLGVPMLVRSCAVFDDSPLIDEVIVVVPEEDLARTEAMLRRSIKKLRTVVPGGSTRQASAKAGLDAVSDRVTFLAIHDAARCLVTATMIEAVFRKAYRTGAAIAATHARDTIKIEGTNGCIGRTEERSRVWHAQTPQVFRATSYRAAAYVAERDSFEGTDDASLLEYIGQPVALVDCGAENMKITLPSDMVVAEVILRLREQDGKGSAVQ